MGRRKNLNNSEIVFFLFPFDEFFELHEIFFVEQFVLFDAVGKLIGVIECGCFRIAVVGFGDFQRFIHCRLDLLIKPVVNAVADEPRGGEK